MEGKKILVTGATGQFGRGLVHVLHRENEVHALARFSKLHVLDEIQKKARVWKVDMSAQRPDMLPRDFDVVFHMAVDWVGDDTVENQQKSFNMTCQFVGDLMYMMDKAVFVLGSTGSVYRHDVKGLCKEDETTVEGGGTYVTVKIAMTQVAMWIARNFGRKAAITRYFWPYAPYQQHGKVDRFLSGGIIGDNPRAIHCRTYIKQHVDKTILAADVASNPPIIFNCATDENLTLGELARIGASITGAKLTERAQSPGYEPGPGHNADTTKLVKYLGPCTVKTEEGFRRYWRARQQDINWPEDWMFEGAMR